MKRGPYSVFTNIKHLFNVLASGNIRLNAETAGSKIKVLQVG